MPVEIIGMVGTRDASEIKGPLVDGPVVDWMDGPVIEPGYLESISRAHDDGGSTGYSLVTGKSPRRVGVAATVLSSTKNLKVIGRAPARIVQPVLLARMPPLSTT